MVRFPLAVRLCVSIASVLLIGRMVHAADGGRPAADRAVVLVSMDGLAGFYLDDPKADMPTLRRLAREGARASGMVCVFPTNTWPNHTTLVTGVAPSVHGVLSNSFIDRATQKTVTLLCDPVFDKDEIVKAPTVYDAAHAAGLKTASVIWPATRNAKSIDWTVPDMLGDAWKQYGTASWLDELRSEGVPVDMQGAWCTATHGGPCRDWLYARMAAQVIEKHAPNLLMVHLVEIDHVEHRAGPSSPDAYWAVRYGDDRLRDIVEAIERSPRRDRTTLIVVSDHGFFPIDIEIRPNVLLKQLGLVPSGAKSSDAKSNDAKSSDVKSANGGAPKRLAWSISQGGAAQLTIFDDSRRAEIRAQLLELLPRVEGVAAVYGPDRFHEIGQATPAEDPHAPDLWLAAKRGYSFSDSDQGDNIRLPRDSHAGAHGYLPDNSELEATCVLSGAGVRHGGSLGKISNLQIAPTIAKLLELELPTAKSPPLSAGLKQ